MSAKTKRLADDNMRRVDAWNRAAGERPDAIPEAAAIAKRALEAAHLAPDSHAALACAAAEIAPFLRAAQPEAGSEEVERSIRLQQLRADIGQVRSLIEVIGDPNDVGPFGNGWRAALLELEQQIELRWGRAAHPEAGSEEGERLRAENEALSEAVDDNYALLQEAQEEGERLRDAARAFVRETGVAHPAIARIPADAPAAVRYDETRAALLALLDARPEADRAPEGPAKDSITDWPKEER